MERKLIKQGDNALTITLPAKWLNGYSLKAGDSVFLENESNRIIINAQKTAPKTKVEIDVGGMDRSAAFQSILALYVDGYDEITIKHKNPLLINEISKELIGMVIERQTSTLSVLKNLIVVPDENIKNIISRIRFMLLEQSNTLVKIAGGEDLLERLQSEEKLLDYNILYSLRYISKYESSKEAYRLFSLCMVIDLIADQITEIGHYIKRNKQLADTIRAAVERYTDLAFRGDLKNLNKELRQFRDKIRTKSFVDGLAYSLAETMYNFIGYLVEKKG